MSQEKGERLRSETYGSNVELVDGRTFQKQCLMIGTRALLSLLMLLAISGALVWSFTNGEAGIIHKEKHDSEFNFTVYIDQYSDGGRLYETQRAPDGSSVATVTTKSHSVWFQNNAKLQLRHRISKEFTIWAQPSFIYITRTKLDGTPTSCVADRSQNYTLYLERHGLARLWRSHDEQIHIKNKKRVFVYQGEPDRVRLPTHNATAFLVLAYAEEESGALLGWDTYFSASDDSNLYKREYWYGGMVTAAPDDSNLEIPAICAGVEHHDVNPSDIPPI